MSKSGASPTARNQARIRWLAAHTPSDLEALALLFADNGIVDDGTIPGRLRAVLAATERRTIPGLHTAIPFSDRGFAGDRAPGGHGFRDPWASSRNQVGHFLTAVRLQTAPQVVAQPIPLFGSVRAIVAAPTTMSDAEVALRLAIGHEKAADPPNGLAAAMAALEAGLIAYKDAIAADAPAQVLYQRIVTTIVAEAARQFQLSLATFREQFQATTDADVAAWNRALRLSARGTALDRQVLEDPHGPLREIAVADGEGNSVQDLRLTLVGWRLGQLIQENAFANRQVVADWLRRTLG